MYVAHLLLKLRKFPNSGQTKHMVYMSFLLHLLLILEGLKSISTSSGSGSLERLLLIADLQFRQFHFRREIWKAHDYLIEDIISSILQLLVRGLKFRLYSHANEVHDSWTLSFLCSPIASCDSTVLQGVSSLLLCK